MPQDRAFANAINPTFEDKLNSILNEIKELLIRKNTKYGNSALEPLRIFSKHDSIAQILIRIDDKLSRINNGSIDDEVINDLIGYLVLLKIARNY